MCLGNFVPFNRIRSNPDYDFLSKYNDTTVDLNNNCDYLAPDDPINVRACKFSVMHFNIRSLCKNFTELLNLLDNILKKRPDVILLCETFLHANNVGRVHIPGYKFHVLNRSSGGGGGVAIYVKSCYDAVLIDDLTKETDDCESLFIRIALENRTILLGEIYRKPNRPEKKFIEFLQYCAEYASQMKYEIVIGCDQNINLLNITNRQVDNLICVMNECGVIPMVTKPTRISKNSATLIDQVYCSESMYRKSHSYIVVTDISDHYPCLCNFNEKPLEPDPVKFIGRKLNDCNISQLCSYLNCYNWQQLNRFNVNDMLDMLLNVINTGLDIFMPKREVVLNGNKQIKEPWVSKGILASSRQSRQNYLEFINGQIDKHKYTEYRNILNKIKRNAKCLYYKRVFTDTYGNMKKSWFYLNRVLGRCNDKSNVPTVIKDESKEIRDVKEICNKFNTYFGNIGRDFNHRVKSSTKSYKSYLVSDVHCTFKFEYITDKIVVKTIASLKNKLSCGNDGLSNKFLKLVNNSICIPLSLIINKTLSTGEIPKLWKNAIVHPLYKSGAHNLLTNYRPISLLPTMSKVMEKIVHQQTYNYFVDNNMYSDKQFGFRANHGCIDCVNKFVYDVTRGLSMKNPTMVTFIDTSKAFDTISRSILIDKLRHYGMTENALSWFRNYFQDRTQKVKLNDSCSNNVSLDYGVGQGSVLGPLVFSIVTMDLFDVPKYCKILGYADDITIYLSYHNMITMYAKMRSDLKLVMDWFCSNKLLINVKKTKMMLISRKKENTYPKCIEMSGVYIERVSNFKLLGIVIDERLSWSDHVSGLLKKIESGIFALNSTKNLLPTFVKRQIYHSFVYSHLNYGIELWGHSCPKNMLKKLQVCQNKSVKCIIGSLSKLSLPEIYKQLKILSVVKICKYNSLKFMYRHEYDTCPKLLRSILNTNLGHDYETRNKQQKMVVLNSLYSNVQDLWLGLPSNMKLLSYTGFASNLKKWLMSN